MAVMELLGLGPEDVRSVAATALAVVLGVFSA